MYRDESSGHTNITVSPWKLSTFALILCLSCKFPITNTWLPRSWGTLCGRRKDFGWLERPVPLSCISVFTPELSICSLWVWLVKVSHSATPGLWQFWGHSPKSGQFMKLMSNSKTSWKSVIQPPSDTSALSNPLILSWAFPQWSLLLELLGNLEVKVVILI